MTRAANGEQLWRYVYAEGTDPKLLGTATKTFGYPGRNPIPVKVP